MSKRIYQYPEVTELQEGDVMLIDKEGNESAKSILASKVAPSLMSKNITERGIYKASDDGVRGYNEVDVNIPYTDVHVATGAVATFEGEDLPLKSLIASIVPVQAGSGDPSPENVRPISGWTGCEVIDDAVYGGFIDWNQLVQNGDFANTTRWDYPSGTFSVANNIGTFTAQSQGQQVTQIIPYKLNHKYLGIMQIKTTTATESVWLRFYGQNKVHTTATTNWQTVATIVNSIVDSTNSFGVRDDRTSGWDAIQIKNANLYDLTQAFGETKANEIYAMEQAEAGSGVAYFKSLFYKDYYSYNSSEITNVSAVNGDTDKYRKYTIPFTDSQGNPVEVYGGSVDVVNGGEQPRTLGSVDMGSLTWEYDSSGVRFYTLDLSTDIFKPGDSNLAKVMCSIYRYMTYRDFANNTDDAVCCIGSPSGRFYVRDSRFTDATAFKTAVTGQKLAYELTTPTTFYTEPTPVRSLDGDNSIWASTGDVDVEYQTVWVRPTE